MIRFVIAGVTLVIGFFFGIGTGSLIYDTTPKIHLNVKCPLEDGKFHETNIPVEVENGETLEIQCAHP